MSRPRAILPPKSFFALAAALAAVVVIAVLSYRSLQQRQTAAQAVRHSADVQRSLWRFLAIATDAETGQRGFLLTKDEHYLEPYEQARGMLPDLIGDLSKLVADNADQQRKVDGLKPIVTAKLTELGQTIELAREGRIDSAMAIVHSDRGKVMMDRMRSTISNISEEEDRLAAGRDAEWAEAVQYSAYVTFGGVGLIALMVIVIGFFSSRDYRLLEAEGWIRRVQLGLTNKMQGDFKPASLADKVMGIVVDQLNARVGAVYMAEPGDRLRLIAGHALDPSMRIGSTIQIGEGLVGEVAKNRKLVHIKHLSEEYLRVSSGTGSGRPRELVIVPATVDGTVQAIVELGFFHTVGADEITALERVSEAIAIAIRTSRDRTRLEELLEETQRQAEELQAQQEELRVSNEELEQQTRALQVSQVQLENQQAELEQINTQLEEQTQSLSHQRDDLARVSTELQRSSEYKSQFLANMSHELRTPLNSTLILAKLLADNREGNLNDEQIKFAQTIYTAGNDLLTLINDILDLSKIEAGMLDVRAEVMPLTRILDELANTFQPVATDKHLQLDFRIAQGGPETIETDPTRIQQILKNLLSNALKFTERGGVSLEIASTPQGQMTFAVHDTGIGISSDQHEAIFEAFRQADGASNRKFGGTGLGLSISRDLARLLGGDLVVDSRPGHGSTFTLVLPARYTATSESQQQVAASGTSVSRPFAPTPVVTLPPRKRVSTPPNVAVGPMPDDRETMDKSSRSILIIEDDGAFSKVLHDLAHELEFKALVASTADTGLALARHYLPSAIVLDVGLPDRSGLAVLDSLKRDSTTRHIPVHVVSATDYTRAALEMGAAGYALKPVARAELVDAFKHLEAKFTQKLRRVLVVEDDAVLRESTAKLLAGDDVETITAGTTAEALDHLKKTTFDCMVVDLALPDRSGLELLEEMAHGEQYGFPPVIVYTGRSLTNDQVHELEKFSRSIIIKGARSPERLLDEVTLFLHQVESAMPPDRQRMLRDARNREAVFEGRRILIAEDDVRNVFALSSVLEPKGAIVEIARNGREAVEAVKNGPPIDLVLMDIMMPEMDGLEATRQLRADNRFTKLPIIALTAKAMIDDREKCLEAGANDYIAKPLDVDKLLSLARVWIRK